MRKKFIAIISLVLVFSISFGLFVFPASATPPGWVQDKPVVMDRFTLSGDQSGQYQNKVNSIGIGVDVFITFELMTKLSDWYNSTTWNFIGENKWLPGSSVLQYIPELAGYVLYDIQSSSYLCNSTGELLIYHAEYRDSGATSPESLYPITTHWEPVSPEDQAKFVKLWSEYDYSNISMSDMVAIQRFWNYTLWKHDDSGSRSYGRAQVVYFKSLGAYVLYDTGIKAYVSINGNVPAYYPQKDTSSAVNQPVNYTDGTDQIINYDTNQVYDQRSDTYNDIDNITYNTDDRSYTVISNDDHSTVYNITNIEYHISYTYINYIGTTAEYESEEYVKYYVLPDGRTSDYVSSEDLASQSLLFDLCLFDKEYTDTHTRSLYHFDGDTNNFSYYDSVFKFTKGSSITYMESNAFGGSLYLDNLAHNFTISNPGWGPGDGDFTLQFRLYMAQTSDTNKYLKVGIQSITDGEIFSIVNNKINNLSTAPVPNGQWVDICVVRANGQLSTYLNGLRVQNVPNNNTFWNSGSFSFQIDDGFSQYIYIDELRIVDFAVYTSNFIPSPVPYDTNNIYVLPDGEFLDDYTIAVQSNIAVSGWQVGGVRPTFVENGFVWVDVNDSFSSGVYQWQNNVWRSVESRLWTGQRWIPLSYFNIKGMKDMWDIADDVEGILPPINTETGFWSWFQNQWTHFRDWYTNFSGGSTKVDVDKVVEEGSGFSLLGTLGDIVSSLVNMASSLVTTVFDGLFTGAASAISGFSDSFGSGGSVLDFATYEGEDIWD